VNEAYAKRFVHNKEREDLHRLQELKKKGLADSDGDDDDDDSEEEDEDGLLPGRTDAQIFETLARIKKRDPSIYVSEAKFYDEEEEEDGREEGDGVEPATKEKKKKKPLYLKDVVARQLLDGGADEDEEDENLKNKKISKTRTAAAQQPVIATYAEEQQELKNAFLQSFAEADSEADDDGEELLRLRPKKAEELGRDKEKQAEEVVSDEEEEEAEKQQQRNKDVGIRQRLESYFGKDDELDDNEKFLKTFLLNQGWIDTEKNRIPSYNEVVVEVSEDEAILEDQDKYEASYNFRFEEGMGSQVMGNPRMVEGSVRKKGEVRKKQRQRKEERLSEQQKAREEELKRLKNLKKKEIMEKLSKIRTVAGASSAEFATLKEEDLEADFDPEEYDQRMKEAFGDEYYRAEDAELKDDEEEEDDDDASDDNIEKPNFDAEDEELGLPKGWTKKVGFAAVREKQKVSTKAKAAFDKNLEDYYKLDYEDMVGDLPTRFKYREVQANTYGLKARDILGTEDKELNQYVSIKKLATYRTEEWKPPRSLRSMMRKQVLGKGKEDPMRKTTQKQIASNQAKSKKEAPDSVEVEEHVTHAVDLSKDTPEAAGEELQVNSQQGNLKKRKDMADAGGETPLSLEQGDLKKSKRRRKKKSGPTAFLPPSRIQAYETVQQPAKKKKKKSNTAR